MGNQQHVHNGNPSRLAVLTLGINNKNVGFLTSQKKLDLPH